VSRVNFFLVKEIQRMHEVPAAWIVCARDGIARERARSSRNAARNRAKADAQGFQRSQHYDYERERLMTTHDPRWRLETLLGQKA
jgi:hypothetical protein